MEIQPGTCRGARPTQSKPTETNNHGLIRSVVSTGSTLSRPSIGYNSPCYSICHVMLWLGIYNPLATSWYHPAICRLCEAPLYTGLNCWLLGLGWCALLWLAADFPVLWWESLYTHDDRFNTRVKPVIHCLLGRVCFWAEPQHMVQAHLTESLGTVVFPSRFPAHLTNYSSQDPLRRVSQAWMCFKCIVCFFLFKK